MPIPRRLLRLVFLFRGRSEDDDEPTRAFRNRGRKIEEVTH